MGMGWDSVVCSVSMCKRKRMISKVTAKEGSWATMFPAQARGGQWCYCDASTM
jgi:hypothetical protein